MSIVVCSELKTTLEQTIYFNDHKRHLIEGVKINIVNYGSPAGTFTLSLKQGVNVLTMVSFTIDDIKEAYDSTDNYSYLYFPLEFNHPVNILKGQYELELSATGYTYDQGSFLGWIKSFENIFNEKQDQYESFQREPFNVLIYERKREDLQ